MSTSNLYQERKTAIHLLRSGYSPKEVASELNRSVFWVYKWQKRFKKMVGVDWKVNLAPQKNTGDN